MTDEELQAAFEKGRHEGELAGRLKAIEVRQQVHKDDFKAVAQDLQKRLTLSERMQYALIGVIGWIQLLPKLEEVFK
ncbi:MAG: hypothetical protein GY752_04150 [bacterium]|nr:hypothetical protein [bacterium]